MGELLGQKYKNNELILIHRERKIYSETFVPGGVLPLLLVDDDDALESEESLDESLELDADEDFEDLDSEDLVERIAAATAAFE